MEEDREFVYLALERCKATLAEAMQVGKCWLPAATAAVYLQAAMLAWRLTSSKFCSSAACLLKGSLPPCPGPH